MAKRIENYTTPIADSFMVVGTGSVGQASGSNDKKDQM